MPRIKGFPEYSHASASMTCDCTSLAELLSVFTLAAGTTDELTFDAVNGFKQSAIGDAKLEWSELTASPVNECTFSFEIEAKVFAYSAAVYSAGLANKPFFYLIAKGLDSHFRRTAGDDGTLAWGGSFDPVNAPTSNAFRDMEGYIPYGSAATHFVYIDVSVNCGLVTVYLNGLPIAEAKMTNGVTTVGGSASIEGANIGGTNGTTAQTPPDIFYRNAQFMPQAIDLKIDPVYRRFAWICDSFGRYGDYSTAGNLKLLGNNVDHFGDATDVAFANTGISGFVPVCHGILNRAGYAPVNGRHETYYRGGSSVLTSAAKSAYKMVERMIANNIEQSGADAGTNCQGDRSGWGTTSIDVIFAILGANNVTGAAVTDYDLIYQGWVDTIQLAVDNGCKRFIMSDCAPTANEGGVFADAQCETNILTYNAATQAAADQFPEAFMCPVYERFGGQAGFDPNDFTADRHPSKYGTYKLATWMAETFLNSV